MGDLPWLKYVFIQIYKSRDLTLLSGWNIFIFLVETQPLSQNCFCILVELFGHEVDWLEKRIDGEQNRANASQCDWTFSLTISVEIQFLSAWCNWDAPALWSICIWIIGRSWDASILAWYVKTVHRSETHLLRRWVYALLTEYAAMYLKGTL